MTSQEPRPDPELRKLAERLAGEQDPNLVPADAATTETDRKLIHELRVHQIEVEMQYEELQRAQTQIAHAHARYFALYDQAPVGYCTVTADGTILEANLTAAQLLGVPKGALPGRPFTAFVNVDDQDAHYLHFRRFSQGGKPQAWDLRLCREDRTSFWARLTITRHGNIGSHEELGGEGPPQAWLTLTDLTETKRSEAERMEALSLLSAGIAHDFNNLLGAMLGNLELYRLDHGPLDSGMALLDAVETQISRASQIVGQLLAYSGKGATPLGTLDLNQQAEESMRLVQVTVSRSATLKLQACRGILLMEGEATQIQQVIMNLLLNAADAVEPGRGEIVLRTGAEVLQGGDLPKGLRPGPHVWLEVADNGSGIPEAIRGRIFDPFFTTKATGRGLGLAAVRGIVERHRGAIQITGLEGQGTRFKMLFPAVTRQVEPQPEGCRDAPAGPPLGEGTILVVDDEDALRAVALAGLRRVGFMTLEARSGEEALQILDQNRDEISLILLDQCMPGISGVEVAQRIRQAGLRMPIILASGLDRDSIFKDAPSDAFADFLSKPYRYQTLLDAVRRVL